MDDDLKKLEDVLDEKAGEVPQFQELPRKTATRAHWRVGRNAAASILVAGVIVIAGSWGLTNVRNPSRVAVPGGTTTQSPATSDNTCLPADLEASASLQGAAGSVEGFLLMTNEGTTTCTLSGKPVLSLVQTAPESVSSGEPVIVNVVDAAPSWQVNGASQPPGWPVVTLEPGSAAAVSVRWSNACPQVSGQVEWMVSDGNGGTKIVVDPSRTTLVPPCNGASEPSTLEVGPYEPAPPQ